MSKKYYGEITMGISIESDRSIEEIKSILDADGLRGDLTLKLLDGTSQETETIAIFDTFWESMDEEDE